MNKIYALIFACLSLQACIGQSETPAAVTNISEYTTATEIEYGTAAGLEFEGTSRDSADALWTTLPRLEDYEIGLYGDDEGHTASVPTAPIQDQFFGDDSGFDFHPAEATDLHEIQASDWW
jgi:hypothetical protein